MQSYHSISSRWGWWLLTAAMTFWLLWATLQPDGHISANDINLTPLAEHGQALACLIEQSCLFQRQALRFLLIDVIGNIVVFVPLGAGLAGALHRANPWQTLRRVTIVGFSLSLLIELIQLTLPSRSTDVDDLLFNTLGVMVGALLLMLFLWVTKNRTLCNVH